MGFLKNKMVFEKNLSSLKRLRISVNDKCSLNCLYCHRDGQFTPRKEEMSTQEIKKIGSEFLKYGVEEIKLAAMEPLLRKDTPEILGYFKEIGVNKTSITTNGILLKHYLNSLERANIDEVSVSLDTLNLDIFNYINQGNSRDFDRTLEGLEALSKSPIPEKNINMTITKSNIKELEAMVLFSKKNNFDLRVIPLISLQNQRSSIQPSSSDLKEITNYLDTLEKITSDNPTRIAYTEYSCGEIKITLIDSLCPDCDSCGRDYALRLTSDGKLKPCLISEIGEIDILTPYRKKNIIEFNKKIQSAIRFKKKGLMKNFNPSGISFEKGFISPEE